MVDLISGLLILFQIFSPLFLMDFVFDANCVNFYWQLYRLSSQKRKVYLSLFPRGKLGIVFKRSSNRLTHKYRSTGQVFTDKLFKLISVNPFNWINQISWVWWSDQSILSKQSNQCGISVQSDHPGRRLGGITVGKKDLFLHPLGVLLSEVRSNVWLFSHTPCVRDSWCAE